MNDEAAYRTVPMSGRLHASDEHCRNVVDRLLPG